MTKTIDLKPLFGILVVSLLGNLTHAFPEITAVQTITPLVTATQINTNAITANVVRPTTPCFTYTSTVPYTGPIPAYCPINPKTCPPHPLCIIIKTSSFKVPCPSLECPKTPTVTVTGPKTCPTCVTGCDTTTTTVKVTPPCPRITLN